MTLRVVIHPSNEVNPEKRNISVNVTDGLNPISNVSVELYDVDAESGDSPIKSCTTGSAGGCTLQNVEDGEYMLGAHTEISGEIYSAQQYITVSSESNSFPLILKGEEKIVDGGGKIT